MKITFSRSEIEKITRDVIVNPPGKVPYTGGSWEKILGAKAKARFERGLQLVGDEGVYLMGNHSLPEGAMPVVSYANEINPKTSKNWYNAKVKAFGGDDGIQFIPIDTINDWLIRNLGNETLSINLTPRAISLL